MDEQGRFRSEVLGLMDVQRADWDQEALTVSDYDEWEPLDPGYICCICRVTWCRTEGWKQLANVFCPNCGADYPEIGVNREP